MALTITFLSDPPKGARRPRVQPPAAPVRRNALLARRLHRHLSAVHDGARRASRCGTHPRSVMPTHSPRVPRAAARPAAAGPAVLCARAGGSAVRAVDVLCVFGGSGQVGARAVVAGDLSRRDLSLLGVLSGVQDCRVSVPERESACASSAVQVSSSRLALGRGDGDYLDWLRRAGCDGIQLPSGRHVSSRRSVQNRHTPLRHDITGYIRRWHQYVPDILLCIPPGPSDTSRDSSWQSFSSDASGRVLQQHMRAVQKKVAHPFGRRGKPARGGEVGEASLEDVHRLCAGDDANSRQFRDSVCTGGARAGLVVWTVGVFHWLTAGPSETENRQANERYYRSPRQSFERTGTARSKRAARPDVSSVALDEEWSTRADEHGDPYAQRICPERLQTASSSQQSGLCFEAVDLVGWEPNSRTIYPRSHSLALPSSATDPSPPPRRWSVTGDLSRGQLLALLPASGPVLGSGAGPARRRLRYSVNAEGGCQEAGDEVEHGAGDAAEEAGGAQVDVEGLAVSARWRAVVA
ncbi:hypothetical protein OPT61_g10322 [Boeremia exigua]|uniref:Uncharacterized protein n=1 Tax=Boeremia exigua TaxID=749465 RepID=A0ACC2HQ71_9PLEO|nr:hypothetical protein OPT61_g10322 [Boeremia exigua]